MVAEAPVAVAVGAAVVARFHLKKKKKKKDLSVYFPSTRFRNETFQIVKNKLTSSESEPELESERAARLCAI